MTLRQSPRFRVRSGARLAWRTWDGCQSVLFDEGSGDTHMLDDVAREALLCLDERQKSSAELAVGLSDRLGVKNDASLQGYIDLLLEQLDDLGLIEAVNE
jgi:PqqD family protein of HPr-rel-A system